MCVCVRLSSRLVCVKCVAQEQDEQSSSPPCWLPGQHLTGIHIRDSVKPGRIGADSEIWEEVPPPRKHTHNTTWERLHSVGQADSTTLAMTERDGRTERGSNYGAAEDGSTAPPCVCVERSTHGRTNLSNRM